MAKNYIHERGVAFLVSSLVANWDKIQTTRFTIDLWDELRGKVEINTRLDYLTTLLTQGRIMDLHIDESNYETMVQESMENIRRELLYSLTYPILGEKNGTELLSKAYIVRLNDLASAMITAGFTDLSKKVESSKEIIVLWSKIRNKNLVHDNRDYLVSVLVTGRIDDLKNELTKPDGINMIVDNYQNLLTDIDQDSHVSKDDLTAAYLTEAITTQTPEIESNGEILSIWKRFKTEMKFNNDEADILTAILTGGLIRNMTMKLDFNYINDIFTRIRNRLMELEDFEVEAKEE
jgi:hypothetical protein